GARVGDRLILTKPLGTGVLSTATKRGRASDEEVKAAIASMSALNFQSMELALPWEVHGATDVTGFSLLGHAREMAIGSKVSLVIDSTQFEFLPGAREHAQAGSIPGGTQRNRDFIGGCVEFGEDVPAVIRDLLFDPQTSGGLLLS